jgi:hypothetical protein
LPFSHLPPGFGKEEKKKRDTHNKRNKQKKTSEEDTREIEHVHKNNKVCFSAYTFFLFMYNSSKTFCKNTRAIQRCASLV